MTSKNPAPYPTAIEDVTADAMARHMAVQAQRSYVQFVGSSALSRDAMARFVYEWGVTFLLREFQERAGITAADAVARDLWDAWNDGDSPGEFLYEWLTEYGIDPESIIAPVLKEGA